MRYIQPGILRPAKVLTVLLIPTLCMGTNANSVCHVSFMRVVLSSFVLAVSQTAPVQDDPIGSGSFISQLKLLLQGDRREHRGACIATH